MQKQYLNKTIIYYNEVINQYTQEISYEPTGESKDIIITVLIADNNRHFVDKDGIHLGNKIQVGTEDNENNYTEVDN